MGVKYLWNILSPIKTEIPLKSLEGQTLAIDLSGWIFESRGIKEMRKKVLNPHLRNLYFRIQHLLLLNITPVFVLDGEIPELKEKTIMQRRQAKSSKSCKKKPVKRRKGGQKRHFISMVKECCKLLDCMGVPYIRAKGEAEAMCAFLNHEGLVDGIVTGDGDAFLYNASTIYRNFSVTGKEPHIDRYQMKDIESNLNLKRESLVALGLLIGCDFCPQGVRGVGKERALKLVKSLREENILNRFETWKDGDMFKRLDQMCKIEKVIHCSTCKHPGSSSEHVRNGCELCESYKYCISQKSDNLCPCAWHDAQLMIKKNSEELSVRKKALDDPSFPNSKVINEFMNAQDVRPTRSLEWRRPQKNKMEMFAVEKMGWSKEYTEKKMLLLLSHWVMRNIQKSGRINDNLDVKAHSIVKKRTIQSIPHYEVLWYREVDNETTDGKFYTTTVKQDLFSSCYQKMVNEFECPCKKLKLK